MFSFKLFSGSLSNGEGGVIYFDGSQGSVLSVTASKFWLASAVSAAGICLVGGRNNSVHNKIVASEFSGLAASTVGGSVLLKDSNLDMELTTFINTFAVSGASALESYHSLVLFASNQFNFTGAPQLTLELSNFSDSASFFDNGGKFCPLPYCTPSRVRNGQVIVPNYSVFLRNLTSNHNCSVIPFVISHCVNLMAATAFAIPPPAPTTAGATAFATQVAQVLVACMTLETVAM
jgi:hypothetical protein